MKKSILDKSLPWAIMACMYLVPHQTSVAATLELPVVVPVGVEPWSEQVIPFDAGMSLKNLRDVRLRLTGQAGGVPYTACMDYRYCCTLPGQIRIEIHGDPEAESLDQVVGSFGSGPRDSFEREWVFDLADFSALEDGVGHLVLDDPAKMFFSNSFQNFVCPAGNGCVMESGTLIFEYGDLVPVADTTWGALKAIYR